MHFPNVPTLVLSGDLDSVTSVTDAQQVTDQFPNATHVIIPNLPHVVAGGDLVGCASSIVLHFVQDLAPGDTSCTKQGARRAHGAAVCAPGERSRCA